ncbi:MAG TPA: hypothetical protein VEM58_01190 [Streptosporangiaceae bacterium]|nr:hypothetical protein [Streptosporangiaceae bacterium]
MASPEPAYERLGAKLLSLPDVVARSVGFMGPVFSSAFVTPLVVGVISASGKGGGVIGLGSTWILRPRQAASTQLADLAAAPGTGERPVSTG